MDWPFYPLLDIYRDHISGKSTNKTMDISRNMIILINFSNKQCHILFYMNCINVISFIFCLVLWLERDLLLCVFKFVENINENCPTLVLCSPTEQLMYYMMAFLTKDNIFLDADINDFLRVQIAKFFKQHENIHFDFTVTSSKIYTILSLIHVF